MRIKTQAISLFLCVYILLVLLYASYIARQVDEPTIRDAFIFKRNSSSTSSITRPAPIKEPKDMAVNRGREPKTNTNNLTTGINTNNLTTGINTTNIRSTCGEITYPTSLAKGDTWYAVDEAKSAYVFSAYYEERSPSTITIIGAKTGNQKYFCQLWYTSAETIVILKEVVAQVHVYGEGHWRRYTSCKFICKLPSNDIPNTVSLVTKSCKSLTNLMPVVTIRKKTFERNFTVCVKPLNSRYGRAYELVEWIEVYRLLGAEKFIIYNYSSAANVVKVLDEYTSQGLVEVVQWPIPMNVKQYPPTKANVEIHEFGLIAAVNDCLYRIREASRYLVFVDADEFIIPHSANSVTWNDMMQELPLKGAYYFQNVFFRKEWNSSDNIFVRKDVAEQYRLVTLLKNEKELHIWRPPERSKYIVQTDSVEDLGNHHVSRMATKPYIVPTSVALLHHYRYWKIYNATQPRLKDETMIVKYKDSIVDNVSRVWLKLKNVELDIPIL